MTEFKQATLERLISNNVEVHPNMSRRELLHILSMAGYGAVIASVTGACGDGPMTAPTPIPDPGQNPNQGNGIELTIPITGFYTGQSAGDGTFPIGGVDVPIRGGNAAITRNMGLLPGRYAVGPVKTSLGMDMSETINLAATGITRDLGGNRTDNKFTVVEQGAVDTVELVRYVLRDNGKSQRITSPLQIGILNSYNYTASSGNITRAEPYQDAHGSVAALLNALNSNASFWSNGIYSNISNSIKLQSRGDQIPENIKSNGWMIIFPYKNISNDAISRSDSGVNGGGSDITWANMGFDPKLPVNELMWTRDFRECLGWAQIRDSAAQTEIMRKYAQLLFNMPPGVEIVNGGFKSNYGSGNSTRQSGAGGIADFFRSFSFR